MLRYAVLHAGWAGSDLAMATKDEGRAKVLARLQARMDRLEAALQASAAIAADAEDAPLPGNRRAPPLARRQQSQRARV